ncbi:LLM class flavin-dependent oxidoreductase [Kitasatospora sp. NPDC002551]|uniref:LLM class flavin-dependent oxidoreductase n=1 Tax=unclassified Kitasatospora TaxID=2633591 RepID=UPI003332DA7E
MTSPAAPPAPSDRSLPPLHLAVALDGAGWHPAAWRAEGARPGELFTAGYWGDLVTEAERGLLDLVTFEDALAVQSVSLRGPDDRTDQVRGRLDAVLIAGRVAPLTSRIGLVPTTNVTHTEPFHLSAALATLDHASLGRAGWRPQISARADDAAHFGRRAPATLAEADLASPETISGRLAALFDDAAESLAAVRGLWSGRAPDLPVTVLAHARIPYELAAKGGDVVFVTPHSPEDTAAVLTEVAAAARAVGRPAERPLKVFADLLVLLDDRPGEAARWKERLDELDGAPLASDAEIFTGTPAELADLLLAWRTVDTAGLRLDGFRLRPARLPHDLRAITRALVPELQRRGAFRTAYRSDTLRGHLDLPAPTGPPS